MEDNRNVIDKYKGWETDLIREDVQKNTFPYAVMMEQWQGDFNISTLIRNANAFGAEKVFYIGKKRYDKRGAVGTNHYTNVIHLSGMCELLELKNEYCFVGVENLGADKSFTMEEFPYGYDQLPQMAAHNLFIFGEEGVGISPEVLNICDIFVEIPMYGSVRSLNVGTASGIIMNDYVNKYRKYWEDLTK